MLASVLLHSFMIPLDESKWSADIAASIYATVKQWRFSYFSFDFIFCFSLLSDGAKLTEYVCANIKACFVSAVCVSVCACNTVENGTRTPIS